MKLFLHQKKLESKWWHRLAKVFYYGVSAIWAIVAIVFIFDANFKTGELLEGLGFWIIFSAICYAIYWRGIVYIVYGSDK